MEFYYCPHCCNTIIYVEDSGERVSCCGRPMIRLEPGVAGLSGGIHVPVWLVTSGAVTVRAGEKAHPMSARHWIQWVALETDRGCSIRRFTPCQRPEAVFPLLPGERVKAAWAFCSRHGLWKRTG